MIRLKTYEAYINDEQTCYYRSETEFIGETFTFKPSGYYEAVGKNNQPIFKYDEHSISNVKELCASKYIGGCVLGSYSMNHLNEYYIYEICETPEIDISNWSGQDFEYLEEVRYRHTVTGKYIGKVILTDYQKNLFDALYVTLSWNDMDEDESDENLKKYGDYFDDIDNSKLNKELKKIKVI